MRSTILCLATLAQLALTAFAAEPEPYKIPLYRRTSDGVVTAAAEALENGVLAGKVQIGTPPQEFTLAFDTTTGYSWVRGSRCKSENCLDRCTYYARRSKTSVPTGEKFSVDYGDECVDTHVYIDTVSFNGLTVHDMPFGGAYRMSGFDKGFDGYLGLGRAVDFNKTKIHGGQLQKRDANMASSAFVPNAYQQGSGIQSSQFGFYTTSDSSGFNQDGTNTGGNTNTGGATTNTGDNTNTGGTTGTTPSGSTNGTVPAASSGAVPQSSAAASPVPSSGTTTGQPATTDNSGNNGGQVTSGGFGFQKRTNKEEPAGYLILGGVDKSLIKGDMEYIPLADPVEGSTRNWDVCIKDANFDNVLNIKQKHMAIAVISSSTNYITMPSDQGTVLKYRISFLPASVCC